MVKIKQSFNRAGPGTVNHSSNLFINKINLLNTITVELEFTDERIYP